MPGRVPPPEGDEVAAGQLATALLEAALAHIRAGAEEMEAGRIALAGASLREASRIIIDLHTALDRDRAPALTAALAPIYRWVCLRLTDAALLSDSSRAREAERAFEPIATAFHRAIGALGGHA